MDIRGYHVKHKRNFDDFLDKAQQVADYAVLNKNKKSSKDVKHIDLPSTIKNQLLRKYGSKNIKNATNVNLIIPNSSAHKFTMKDGSIKYYHNIEYENGKVMIKPLRTTFNWNPGKEIDKIKQIEISKNKFMITVTIKKNNNENNSDEFNDILGLDLNCGVGRHIINAANLKTNEVLNLGKYGPNIRKKYFMKRKKQKIKSNKESRIIKDIDHKLSRKIVDYALKNKLKIVVEDLKGIRTGKRKDPKKGKGCREGNRIVNSWSFYRLQQFIEYKSKELNIPYIKVNPHYTSQECSYCTIIGERDKSKFICKNKFCKSYNIVRNADINAAFNVGKRSLLLGGRTT